MNILVSFNTSNDRCSIIYTDTIHYVILFIDTSIMVETTEAHLVIKTSHLAVIVSNAFDYLCYAPLLAIIRKHLLTGSEGESVNGLL